MEKLNIKIGQKFGNLIIISEINKQDRKNIKKRRFLCRCICENIKEVDLIHLTRGDIVSCGCYIPNMNRNRKGDKSPTWKGGRIKSQGYILIYDPTHRRAKSSGYVREHILVMENKLNRELYPNENVHHLNGNKEDNRPENLELWSTSQPPGQRISDKIKWAKEILTLYENVKF